MASRTKGSVAQPIEIVHGGADADRTTLGQAVYERIKDDIFEFRMAPGQRYSEQELANHLGVSRTPLRFALHVLAREGYLVPRRRPCRLAGQALRPRLLRGPVRLPHRDRADRGAPPVPLDPAPDLGGCATSGACPERLRVTDGKLVARNDERLHSTLVALAGNPEMQRTHADLTERIRIIRRLDFIEPRASRRPTTSTPRSSAPCWRARRPRPRCWSGPTSARRAPRSATSRCTACRWPRRRARACARPRRTISMEAFDTWLVGGHLLDPAQGRDGPFDIGVRDGRIAAVAAPRQRRRGEAAHRLRRPAGPARH